MVELSRMTGLWSRMFSEVKANRDIDDDTNIDNVIEHIICFTEMTGGMLCGGFPRYLASIDARRHPDISRRNKGDTPNVLSYLANGGDLDFFFRDSNDFDASVCMMTMNVNALNISRRKERLPFIVLETCDSLLRNAVNFKLTFQRGRFYDHNAFKVQLIKKQFTDLEPTLSGFDMTNSMISKVDDDIVCHPDWLKLERSRTIDVDHMNGPFALGRVRKYINRHRYRHLTGTSWSKIFSRVESLVSELGKDPITTFIGSRLRLSYNGMSAVSDFNMIVQKCPDDVCIESQGVYSDIVDVTIRKELNRRHESKTFVKSPPKTHELREISPSNEDMY